MASKGAVWILSPTGTIRPGFYRVKMIKRGPWIPVSLILIDGDRDEDGNLASDQRYELTVDREPQDWATYHPLTGEQIDEAEFKYLCRCREYDQTYVSQMADARTPIDPLTSPIPFS